MLEKFNYVNHIGEELEFGKFPLFANYNDLRDFSWDVKSKNDKISGFSKGIVSKSIPIIIICSSDAEGLRMRNEIFEICEKDILANKPGKIVIGDYYLQCYITGSTKSEYLVSRRCLQIDLSIQTDSPEWVKESLYAFRSNSGGNGSFLDFAYDFPFDYQNSLQIGEISNSGIIANNFKIVIYGAAINPSIFIGNHEYSVECEIGKSEYLSIDSVAKTIILTKENGDKINLFNNRNKDSYIFEKIPPGISKVSAVNEGLSYDITLLEERSEPKWI